MLPRAVKIFNVIGLDIKLDPSWFLIAALITWTLSRAYFPSVLSDRDGTVYLAMALSAMLGFFASLLVHELAHAVIARHFSVPTQSITLFLFGGVTELGVEPKSANSEFWISLTGPVMSLVLAAGFWLLAEASSIVPEVSTITAVFRYLALINLVIALFNLVPAFPLDGGRILRAFLWHRTGDILKATETAAKVGIVFAYILLILGVVALFQDGVIAGLWYVMIGLFVLAAAKSSYQNQLIQIVFDDKTVRTLMHADPIIVRPDVTLSDFVNQIMLRHGVSFVPVVEDGVLLGHMNPKLLSDIDREHWSSTYVDDVFAGFDADTFVPPDLSVHALLERISRTGRRKFLVVDNNSLVGVITLSDLTRFLSLFESYGTIKASDAPGHGLG